MSNSSKDSFQFIRQNFAPVFDVLEKTTESLGIRFCLIGAQSLEVWIKHLDLNNRLTTDVDYCVELANAEAWDTLCRILTDKYGFRKDVKEPYRFHGAGQVLDILPFGGIAVDDEVTFRDPVMVLSVTGFSEITRNASAQIEGWNILTLPGLCAKKLLVYDEKPDRKKDFADFLFVLANYDKILGEQVFDDPIFLSMIAGRVDTEIAVASLLGRQLKQAVNSSPTLLNKMAAALRKELRGLTTEEIIENHRDVANRNLEQRQLRGLVEIITVLETHTETRQ